MRKRVLLLLAVLLLVAVPAFAKERYALMMYGRKDISPKDVVYLRNSVLSEVDSVHLDVMGKDVTSGDIEKRPERYAGFIRVMLMESKEIQGCVMMDMVRFGSEERSGTFLRDGFDRRTILRRLAKDVSVFIEQEESRGF